MADVKSKKPVGSAATSKGVRMYPSNSLPQQRRDPYDNLSALAVLRDAYGTKK
ncbi:hypothetical protein [Methylobacterium sp. Leaf94]|uniref:hypothetical protein n=1 Tax=Methylobacterium sp. Leaf94 TaxID=1736250 RepID=UPI000A83E874|nr:hypothetical protein [Methylobacterium sp. Leaf94]